jgi:hypothetical protein
VLLLLLLLLCNSRGSRPYHSARGGIELQAQVCYLDLCISLSTKDQQKINKASMLYEILLIHLFEILCA